jgi:hypothetical protein
VCLDNSLAASVAPLKFLKISLEPLATTNTVLPT